MNSDQTKEPQIVRQHYVLRNSSEEQDAASLAPHYHDTVVGARSRRSSVNVEPMAMPTIYHENIAPVKKTLNLGEAMTIRAPQSLRSPHHHSEDQRNGKALSTVPNANMNRFILPHIEGIRLLPLLCGVMKSPEDNLRSDLASTVSFVLTGYLLTLSLTQKQTFSWLEFIMGYAASRAQKQLPALAFVVAVTAIIASALCMPILVDNSQSTAVTGLLGMTNFLFIAEHHGIPNEHSLFDHLWMSSIHIQFVALLPILLATTRASGPIGSRVDGPAKALIITGALSIASFASLIIISNSLVNLTLLGQFWKFGIGMLCAFVHMITPKPTSINNLVLRKFISVVILVLLGLTLLFGTSHKQSFRSPLTIAVGCLTAMTITMNRDGSSTVAIILGRVGFISPLLYPIFLWQWPLYILFVNLLPNYTTMTQIILYACTLGISILTYIVVQYPLQHLRYSNWCKAIVWNKVLLLTAIITVIVVHRLPQPICWVTRDVIAQRYPDYAVGAPLAVTGLSKYCSGYELENHTNLNLEYKTYCCKDIENNDYLQHATAGLGGMDNVLPSLEHCSFHPTSGDLPTEDGCRSNHSIKWNNHEHYGKLMLVGDQAAMEFDLQAYQIAKALKLDYEPLYTTNGILFDDLMPQECNAENIQPPIEDAGYIQRRAVNYYLNTAPENSVNVVIVLLSDLTSRFANTTNTNCAKEFARHLNHYSETWGQDYGATTISLRHDVGSYSSHNGTWDLARSNDIVDALEDHQDANPFLKLVDISGKIADSKQKMKQLLLTPKRNRVSCLGKLALHTLYLREVQDAISATSEAFGIYLSHEFDDSESKMQDIETVSGSALQEQEIPDNAVIIQDDIIAIPPIQSHDSQN